MEKLIKELQTAKENVIRLLDHENWLIDMHDIEYRAYKVKTIRQKIKEFL